VSAEGDSSSHIEAFDQDPFRPACFLESNGTRSRPPIDDEAMQTDFYFEDICEDVGPRPAVYDSLGHRVDVSSLIRCELSIHPAAYDAPQRAELRAQGLRLGHMRVASSITSVFPH
jgi:hypothetical protein